MKKHLQCEITHTTGYNKTFFYLLTTSAIKHKILFVKALDSQTTMGQTPWAKLYFSHTVSQTVSFSRANRTPRHGDGLANRV
jgi:hypothetical protein